MTAQDVSAVQPGGITVGFPGPLRTLLSGWWPKRTSRTNLLCPYCGCSEWECDGGDVTRAVAA